MKFKDLERTIQMICSHLEEQDDYGLYCIHAEHDEFGFDLSNFNLSVEEIRELQKIGWMLGCGALYDETDSERWDALEKLSDDEVLDLWSNYTEIYTFC